MNVERSGQGVSNKTQVSGFNDQWKAEPFVCLIQREMCNIPRVASVLVPCQPWHREPLLSRLCLFSQNKACLESLFIEGVIGKTEN